MAMVYPLCYPFNRWRKHLDQNIIWYASNGSNSGRARCSAFFATDYNVNGQVYRTTDDQNYVIALDVGEHAYGFWFSTNPLNGRVYVSFVYGERNGGNPADNLAAMYTSDNNGASWTLYRSFNTVTSYHGAYSGSNFVNGVMYYSVWLDSGWQNGTKIYPVYGASSSDQALNVIAADSLAFTLSQLSSSTISAVLLGLGSIAALTTSKSKILGAKFFRLFSNLRHRASSGLANHLSSLVLLERFACR